MKITREIWIKNSTVVLMFAVAGVAAADILSYDRTKAQMVPPRNQWYKQNDYNSPIVGIWDELTDVVLPNDLLVDAIPGGVYGSKEDLGTYHIPAGTRVDSAYLNYHPGTRRMVDTTVTFTGRVLGVLVESDWPRVDRLLSTDGFILPTVPRQNIPVRHFDRRGVDFPQARLMNATQAVDWIEVSDHSVTIHIGGADPSDQIRVITEHVETSTILPRNLPGRVAGTSAPTAPRQGQAPAQNGRAAPQAQPAAQPGHVKAGPNGKPGTPSIPSPVTRPVRGVPRPVRRP